MSKPNGTRTGGTAAPARILRAACALGLAAGLGACAGGGPSWFGRGAATAPAVSNPNVVASSDPVVVFAASAQPGAGNRVTLPNGQAATVRLVRSYHSANGRECREVLVGGGIAERQRLVCATENGWAEVRPLLRGGGAARP
jgi:hypothetical protein